MDYILLPGMDGNASLLKPLMAALPDGVRKFARCYSTDTVVSYDQLLTMLQSAVPERPYFLIAESYSTPLAIRFAASNPPHLRGLVLCAGFASSPLRGWRRQAARIVSPWLFRLPPPRWMLERFLIGRAADPALLKYLQGSIAAVKPNVLAARLREVLDCNVCGDLAKIAVPILYLQAQHDRLVGPPSLDQILRVKPDVTVRQVPAPHLLLQREPEKAAAAIAKFVQEKVRGMAISPAPGATSP